MPEQKQEKVLCKRCAMDTSILGVRLDAKGVCNFCYMHDQLDKRFPVGEKGAEILKKFAKRIKKAGEGKKYDCIVGVSGGRDTSYCLYYVKEVMGLRPLAVHFDNGWDSEIAKSNLAKLCDKLDVELHTIIMDWPESRELTNATIRACVPYIDLTDDIGIANSLYRTAVKEDVRYIILSHSFREEGVTPLSWNYIDGRYTRAIVEQFCTIPLKQFQNVELKNIIYWILWKRIRVINITNYYDDTGEKIEQFLKEKFDWQDTGQHHLDNELFTLVYYYARRKFGFDWRVVELSAKVRTGVITRDEALKALSEVPYFEDEERVEHCLRKQGLSREEFEAIVNAPNKYFTDYPSYYPLLRKFKWFVWILCKFHAIPAHTYEKFFNAI